LKQKFEENKRAYIDNASNSSSSSSESEEEEANLCLITDATSSSKSSVSSSNFEIEKNYDQLFDAFNELYEEEEKILSYSNNRLKRENKWLENRLKQLQKENYNLKYDIDVI